MTLQSVANQTVKPDEVIIVDNASTDNTKEVVEKYKKYGFKYVRNETNLGMAGNHNRCIELAKNELFTFLPSDDLMAPTWYEEWRQVIAEHEAGLYISPLSIMNSDLQVIMAFPIFDKDTSVTQPDVTKVLFEHYLTGIPPMGMYVYRKSVFEKIGGYNPKDGSECDFKVGMKLLETCDIYYHHKFLFVFREHAERTFDTKKEDRNAKFFERFEKYLGMVKDIYEKRYKNALDHRYYLHGTLLMNLCNINLYAAQFEFSKIIKSYQLVHKYFPDYFSEGEDWRAFAKYQLEFVRRALTMKRVPKYVSDQLSWLKDLKKMMI